MRVKPVAGMMLTLLLISMLTLAFTSHPVGASGTIYIRLDGSIDPPTANITTFDNVTYTFTDNIYDEIVVERDNLVVDGAGYTLQGIGAYPTKGILLSGRSNVTIKNTEINAFHYGIYLYYSSNNTVSSNTIANNTYGVFLAWSSNNTVSGNTITNNIDGIFLSSSSNNNTVSGNNITNNYYGVLLSSSSSNTLRNNDASNNKYNFDVYGSSLSHYIQDVDDSNSVDGQSVYYWVNRRDRVVPLDAGYVALVNCTNITVQNVNLTNNGPGILLAFTKNSTITGNNITNNNYAGIYLDYSSNNSVSGNNITKNNYGIRLYQSSNNTVSGNTITANNRGVYLFSSSNNSISGNNIKNNYNYGIHLYYSSNNTVSGNNITNNGYGVRLYSFSNNTFCHNNFIDNTWQVYISTPGNASFWDDGFPSGGNYWSNHVCTGNPSDGSQPYIIDANNVDHYPFQIPNGWLLHQLTVASSPIIGVTFTINGDAQTTPYTEWIPEGSCTLVMPRTHNGYVWSHWLEDGDSNRIKTVVMDTNITLTGVFTQAPPPSPVGGKATPINKIVIESELQNPWTWLTTIILSIATAAAFTKLKKKRQ